MIYFINHLLLIIIIISHCLNYLYINHFVIIYLLSLLFNFIIII